MTPPSPPAPLRMSYLAPDATQGSVPKRIMSFQDEGFVVTSYTFRRDRPSKFDPVCENVDLGAVPNEQYLKRILHTFGIFWKFWPKRDLLKKTDIFYARLLDVALIAVILRRLFNPRAKLYYEVCDIRRVFMNNGLKGKLARAAERWLLKRVDCVVVNSPHFLEHFYEPVQSYHGRSFVLQNKMFSRDLSRFQDFRKPIDALAVDRPLVIAWFGNLDDPYTWEAIMAVATLYPTRVRFYLRGYIILDENSVLSFIDRTANIEYGGAFNNLTDLDEMYGKVDIVLGLDLMDQDGNSWWLLPNSLYEAGAFAKPLITSAGTATAKRVSAQGTGWVLAEPVRDTLANFVENTSWDEYRNMVANLQRLDPAEFAGQDEVHDLAELMRSDLADSGAAPPR